MLLNSSCKKDHLPNFYFQCKVNGVLYEPDNCANCNGKELIGDTTLLLGANRGFEALSIGIIDNSPLSISIRAVLQRYKGDHAT